MYKAEEMFGKGHLSENTKTSSDPKKSDLKIGSPFDAYYC